jgi:hypothetical protein
MSTLILVAVDQQSSPARSSTYRLESRLARLTGGGTTGNERLTAATGAMLIVLLAVLGITILQVRQLISIHLFVGMLLIPPVLLKMGTTGYRFVRYYTSDPAYVRKGPPEALLRLLAPLVVLTSVIVFASGVGLLFVGPSSRDTLLPIHKVSFFAWLAVMAVHVLGHLPGMSEPLRADFMGSHSPQLSSDITGRSGRVLALAGALVGGVVLAVLVIPEFGPWIHSASIFHGGDH